MAFVRRMRPKSTTEDLNFCLRIPTEQKAYNGPTYAYIFRYTYFITCISKTKPGSIHQRLYNELFPHGTVKKTTFGTSTEECYTKIPKSAVLCELKERSVQQWQNEWERSSKRAKTKSFFPKNRG
jgi:hypothetical protein